MNNTIICRLRASYNDVEGVRPGLEVRQRIGNKSIYSPFTELEWSVHTPGGGDEWY